MGCGGAFRVYCIFIERALYDTVLCGNTGRVLDGGWRLESLGGVIGTWPVRRYRRHRRGKFVVVVGICGDINGDAIERDLAELTYSSDGLDVRYGATRCPDVEIVVTLYPLNTVTPG